MSVTVELDLPEGLIQQARQMGLLDNRRVAEWLAGEVRRRAAGQERVNEKALDEIRSRAGRTTIHGRDSAEIKRSPTGRAARAVSCVVNIKMCSCRVRCGRGTLAISGRATGRFSHTLLLCPCHGGIRGSNQRKFQKRLEQRGQSARELISPFRAASLIVESPACPCPPPCAIPMTFMCSPARRARVQRRQRHRHRCDNDPPLDGNFWRHTDFDRAVGPSKNCGIAAV